MRERAALRCRAPNTQLPVEPLPPHGWIPVCAVELTQHPLPAVQPETLHPTLPHTAPPHLCCCLLIWRRYTISSMVPAAMKRNTCGINVKRNNSTNQSNEVEHLGRAGRGLDGPGPLVSPVAEKTHESLRQGQGGATLPANSVPTLPQLLWQGSLLGWLRFQPVRQPSAQTRLRRAAGDRSTSLPWVQPRPAPPPNPGSPAQPSPGPKPTCTPPPPQPPPPDCPSMPAAKQQTGHPTATSRFWPMRKALSWAWRSEAGFQDGSKITTLLAAVRLRPVPPAAWRWSGQWGQGSLCPPSVSLILGGVNSTLPSMLHCAPAIHSIPMQAPGSRLTSQGQPTRTFLPTTHLPELRLGI